MNFLRQICKIFCLSPNYKNRVFGLDLMRALAIILVLISHSGIVLEKANTGFPWIRLIDGVELFFVLSGFLIGGILLKTYNSDNFGPKSIFIFWIRRWFRTLPNYWFVLILNIIFVYFGVINEDFTQFSWKFFFFLQNFSSGFVGFFWESWSLSVEEWFYLLFPIILLIFNVLLFFFKSKKIIFLLATFSFLAASFFLRFFVAADYNVDDFWLGVNIGKVVIFRFDGIALGLFAAFLKYYYPKLWFKSRNWSFVLGLIICIFVIYFQWQPNDFDSKVLKYFYISFFCFLFLPKFDSMKSAPVFLTKCVTHVSLVSYSMYLINLALVAEVIRDNFTPNTPSQAWLAFALFLMITFLVSTLIYKFFEKPIMDLRNRF